MKENQNNHYFNEWWNEQVKNYAHSKDVCIRAFIPKSGVIWRDRPNSICGSIAKAEPAPIFMMEWAQSNPRPNMTRDEFIVALAKRVEQLEAALAEKGGSR